MLKDNFTHEAVSWDDVGRLPELIVKDAAIAKLVSESGSRC